MIRKPEQIHFTDEATQFVFKVANNLGKRFSAKVCLIQSEDIRFKIARIAAAAAGRTFSTKDGINLLVNKAHVQFAFNFLYHIYDKPCSGYAALSDTENARSTLRNPEEVRGIILDTVPGAALDIVDGFLEHKQLRARDLADYAGIQVPYAQDVIAELVRNRAIIKDYKGYAKKEAFKLFLLALRSELTNEEGRVTQPEK